jgi:outer membrane immunogenic protein
MTLRKIIRTGAAALGALAVASVSQANAADLYGGLKEAPVYVPAPLWTGFYAGGHLGAAWENLSFNNRQFDDGCWGNALCSGVASTYYYNPAILNPDKRSDADAFGGIQFGYNFQSPGAFVYGIEVDLGGMSLNGHSRANGNTSYGLTTEGAPVFSTPVAFDGYAQGGFYGDVTGRLGYAWGPALLYAKGGFAFLNASLHLRESVYGNWGSSSPCLGWGYCDFGQDRSTTLTGWTVGGGLEWKVSPLWSIKVEYLHFDFGNFNNNCCNDWFSQQSWNVNNNWDNHANLTVDTVKLGFNYFWNAPPAPLK